MVDLTKKSITKGVVATLALSVGATITASAAVTRVSGADRYATSTQVLDSWPTTPTTAILAAGAGHDVDALTVAPLAKQKNAPIILVDKTATTAAIVAQFTKYDTIYIANGTGVISQDVETALTAAGKTVIRLGGATRYVTALNIAKAFGTATDIVVANGDDTHLVDSLSIASIAAAKGMPIFLTSYATSLDSAEASYAKGLAATNVYALGGPTLVSDSSLTGLGTVTRLAGAGRYETNAKIVTNFKNDAALDLSNIYIASGEDANLIDSLVAAPLAGLKKAPIVFAHNSINADVSSLLSGVIGAKTNITVIGGTGAVSDVAFSAIQNIQTPGSGNIGGAVSVSSVSAISATSFKVVFNQAPTDTSKIAVTVLQGTIPVTVTTAWNASNTEATVSSSTNLPAGTYTINVKNGTTDLGTSTVAITQQKIAKINITSTKLGVTNTTTGAGLGYGYATYNVIDQYGNDITTSSLANSLTFQSGVSTNIDAKNGIIKLTPNMNLLQFTNVVITGYDTTSGVSTSATLTVSTQVGTLSDINLSALTNADNKLLTAGDTSSLFYIKYTATDMSGNPTTDYGTVLNGLILNTNKQLTVSNSDVTATVVPDPSDSNKAAIQVQYIGTTSLSMDMPIVITAMTYTGKTSTLNVTLKKAATVDTITLNAPAYNIAVGENKEIPFTAFDQNGVALTKYSDIVGPDPSAPLVSVSGAYWYENVNGTASLRAGVATTPGSTTSAGAGFAANGQQVITATTKTGKYSSLTLNIQKKVVADSITLDTSVLKPIMQSTQSGNSATQKVDFGYDKGGLTLKDQYGRVIDMTTGTNGKVGTNGQYYVIAKPVGGSIVASGKATTGENQITITAGAVGSSTVTFSLYSNDPTDQNGNPRDITAAIDTKSETFSVIANTDITDYTIDTVANPIYTAVTTGSSIVTPTDVDYEANPVVYGKTASGAKVVLAGTPIVGASVDSSDFLTFSGLGTASSVTPVTPITSANPVAADEIEVSARTLSDATKTGSSTTLAVTVLGADGNIHSVTTPIKSSTDAPKAVTIDAFVATQIAGISRSGDIITLQPAIPGNYASLLGSTLAKYNANGAAGKQNIYISGTDQYGETGAPLAQFILVSKTIGSTFAIDSNGTITGYGAINDVVTVSGVTSNGLIKTIEIDFK